MATMYLNKQMKRKLKTLTYQYMKQLLHLQELVEVELLVILQVFKQQETVMVHLLKYTVLYLLNQ